MLKLDHISKRYQTRRGEVLALDDVSLDVEPGQLIALRGASGSGKTTLLLAAGSMLKPTQGTVSVGQQDIYGISGRARAAFRNSNVGFVFQMFHLIPYLSVLENVQLAAAREQDLIECTSILEHFKLQDRIHHRPCELSAGENQRAAIARALIKRPKLLLADEPTGNLDSDNAETVMQYLHEYAESGGMVVVASHAEIEETFLTHTVYLESGKIKTDAEHV
ncbi:MAG: ABC transporter ATP-binding protein [Candidatus Hydrogenedentota bacterium]